MDTNEVSFVSSFDEFTQLEEVIVGHADGFKGHYLDNSFDLFYWSNIQSFVRANNFFKGNNGIISWPKIQINEQIIEELKEDIHGLVDTLEKLGVKVRRPAPVVGNDQIQTPFWSSYQFTPLNVRDNAIILGSTIVETSPHIRGRLFENDYLKPLFYEYLDNGARWVCMPRPSLSAGTLDSGFFSFDKDDSAGLEDTTLVQKLEGMSYEMVFDGAQCMRIGQDVLVNVANKNHELGFKWLQAFFGDTFKFHRLEKIADSHIDSMVIPLRPGLLLLRYKHVLDSLPEALQKWDYLIAPQPDASQYPVYYHGDNQLVISSLYLDMNILSVNEKTVIANPQHSSLITMLETQGFTVVPVRHRHRRLFGGGFHCFTLDIRRKGKLISYL